MDPLPPKHLESTAGNPIYPTGIGTGEMIFSFVECSDAECSVSSRVGEYDSMMLRIGFSKCCTHFNPESDEVTLQIDHAKQLNESSITVIFYSIGLSKDGQIEQLNAVSSIGDFCSIIKTTFRANTSPTLERIPIDVYNALSEEPKVSMERFVRWIKMTHAMNTGSTDLSKVVLTANFGSCHDHMVLLRTMIGWGVEPLDVRLADSLALFKMTKDIEKHEEIASLVAKYAAWMRHEPQYQNDNYNNPRALRALVMTEFPQTNAACYAVSIRCTKFMLRTGLNNLAFGYWKYKHCPMSDRAVICEESGKLVHWRVRA